MGVVKFKGRLSANEGVMKEGERVEGFWVKEKEGFGLAFGWNLRPTKVK
jgi:hypothetical protein